MSSTTIVVDCDIVAYRCAAANESRSIKVTHKLTGQTTEHAHRTAFKEHIKGEFDVEEFEIEDVKNAEDISFAFNAMNTTIQALKSSCEASKVELYLSGKNNFRDSLPLPSKYKGKRSSTDRPLQLKECRDYLVKHKKAIIVDGMEVDDMLAHRCHEGRKDKVKNIACTIDGDQYGVAGWMYNWTKMEEPKLIQDLGEIYLTEGNKDFYGEGRKFFYAQWILGDATDCFKPSELSGKKFGVVSMYKLLSECKTDKECVQAVYDQYKKWYPEPITYIAWDEKEYTKDVIEIMDMYAACAHMKRFEGDVFDTKKLLETLEIYL